uniref:NADPH-dependent FMN reductase n=1 Tax=Rhodopseudomonas palustris (strain DX-1) TaxID=652103 RepID=E6VI37_RHOPX
MSAVKILIIPGSLRTGSHNVRLAAAAARELARADVDATWLSLADYPLPIYDADLEAKSGVPKNAVGLKRMIGAHHGVLIVSPEYNSAPPPLLKNAIDWVSRVADPHEAPGQVFRDRAFALAAASEGKLGGARCLARAAADSDRLPRTGDSQSARAVVRSHGLRRRRQAQAPRRQRCPAGDGPAIDRFRPADDEVTSS